NWSLHKPPLGLEHYGTGGSSPSIAAIMRGPSAAQICRYSSAAVANWGVCGVNSSDSARCRDNASNGTIKIAATSTQHFSMCTRTFSLRTSLQSMQDRHIEKMVGDLSAIFDIDVNRMGIGGIRQGIHADTFTCP